MNTRLPIRLTLLLFVALMPWASSPSYLIVVEAGDYERRQTVTSFPLPDDLDGDAFVLRGRQGATVPVQVDADRRAWFILDRLGASQTHTYRLEPTSAAAPHDGVWHQGDATLRFQVGEQPVLHYHAAKTELPRPNIDPIYRRGGYLHPVYTPSGRVVTDDYPMNHLHHHGIWAAWTNTLFQGRTPDFWNMGAGKGTVEVVALDRSWDGPVHGGLHARHRYVDLSGEQRVTALHEQWEIRVYNVTATERPYHLFDLRLTQTTATDSALVLPEYRYGGVGFRGHWDWNGPRNTTFLTSEGKDRSDGHATRARWCHIGGLVDGTLAGIALLGHPDNVEAPQPMRIHPNEPFFNYAPSQAGDGSIEPGTPHVAQYRFVTYDGPPDPDALDRLWNDYAYPPVVQMRRD